MRRYLLLLVLLFPLHAFSQDFSLPINGTHCGPQENGWTSCAVTLTYDVDHGEHNFSVEDTDYGTHYYFEDKNGNAIAGCESRSSKGETSFWGDWTPDCDYSITADGEYELHAYIEDGTIKEVHSWHFTVKKKKPDLVVSSLSLSNLTLEAGDAATVYYTIKNQGQVSTGSGSQHCVYWSTDTVITQGDSCLDEDSQFSIGAGSTNSETTYVSIPNSAEAGTYYLGVYADYNLKIDESVENNNSDLVEVVVTAKQEITNVYWEAPLQRLAGDSVGMFADVIGFDEGTTITFRIYEDDIVGDDPIQSIVTTIKSDATSDKLYAQATWNAVYTDDASGDPEYYFDAVISGISSSSGTGDSDLLTVLKADVPDIDFTAIEQGAILQFTPLPIVGENTNIKVGIKNNSTVPINSAFSVTLTDTTENVEIYTWNISSLTAKETLTLTVPEEAYSASHCPNYCFVTKGNHRLKVSISAPNVENELASNNVFESSVDVNLLGSTTSYLTVISHGYTFSGTLEDWPSDMAEAIQNRSMNLVGNTQIWTFNPSSGSLTETGELLEGAKHHIVVHNWAELSNNLSAGYSEASSQSLMGAIAQLQLNVSIDSFDFIHLIGHSRGTVVNSELAQRLLSADMPVTQMTTLDPHDWGLIDRIYSDFDVNPELNDNGVVNWQGITWLDNYWQTSDLLLTGRHISGSSSKKLYEMGHSDVHEMYYGTIDLFSDTVESTWYHFNAIERREHGYNLSDIGGLKNLRNSDNYLFDNQFSAEGQSTNTFDWFNLGHGIVNGNLNRTTYGLTENTEHKPGFELVDTGETKATRVVSASGDTQLYLENSAKPVVINPFYIPKQVSEISVEVCNASVNKQASLLATLTQQEVVEYPYNVSANTCSIITIPTITFGAGKLVLRLHSAMPGDGLYVDNIMFSGYRDSSPETDQDNDGIDDAFDNCPSIANEQQINTDDDTLGDACDLDDDNDGMPDTYEISAGLNPLINDAAIDSDNDGLTNFDEFQFGTNPLVADSDGDGINDKLDNTPLAPDTIDTDIIVSVYKLFDINNDGRDEVGIFSIENNAPFLKIVDTLNGNELNTVIWPANSYVQSTIRLHILPDMDGDGTIDIALFGIRQNEEHAGKAQLFVKNAVTGNAIKAFNWQANWKYSSAKVLSDLNGDGIPEVALEGKFKEDSRPQLKVLNGDTRDDYATYSFPDIYNSPQYFQHGDFDGDGVDEISIFGRIKHNNKIQIKLISGRDADNKFTAYNYPDRWDNISWNKLFDMNSDGLADWGLFGKSNEDSRIMLMVKDAREIKGLLASYAWPEMDNPQLLITPDLTADNVAELAVAGWRPDTMRNQIQVKDGQDRNALIATYTWADKWDDVVFHSFDDMNNDGYPEFALQGTNRATSNNELLIVDGSSTSSLRTIRFGSNWLEAPELKQVKNVNGDMISDLLLTGLSIDGKAVVTLYSGSTGKIVATHLH
ncbi:hypothetical protein C7Y69_03220 [Alteromonas sp. KS69]|uniref:CARDB domain-containing protein n=1 Tax=Alteromonas sp. KS69 TaxID=2109917 RepID=UPI000F862C9D|nr:CARDB domain-containing protein [Alteromonas sp. KS69]RUP83076.1 hypothetical protein C7Y69_03220 [Alteromonas sp. KS69]|tara:strand:- start:28502 stop:32881 length:4380 start_codon:yes stop_codon:yes gene_type:complete